MDTTHGNELGASEIKILKLFRAAQETKVAAIADEAGLEFESAYGYCLLLSDRGIAEEIKSVVSFRLTEKGRGICATLGQ